MECSETKKHLSEYIDGVLDTENAAKVEDHLGSCAHCRSELEDLKRVIESLGSMDAVEAPKGFMEGVHKRIEHRSWWTAISQTLFVPFRVKIPIQAASLAAACILVVLVFYNMKNQEEVSTLMQEPGRPVAAEKPMEAAPQLVKPRKASRPAPALMKAEAVLEKKTEKPAQLVLRVSKGIEYKSYRTGTPASPSEERLAQRAGKPKEGYLDQMAGAKPSKDILAGKAASVEADLAEESAKAPATAAKKRMADKAKISVTRGHDQLSARMGQWTREAGGRVLRTEYEETGDRPVRFLVEIPAGRLANFLEKLSGIGSLESTPEISHQKTSKTVKLNILLRYDR